MKKVKRIIAALLLVCILFALSGCGVIDDLRKTHAKYVVGSDKIELCGQIYKRIESLPEKMHGEYFYTVYVTMPDVPLLLSQAYCVIGHLNGDRTVLALSYGDVYLREDVYDDAVSELASPIEYTRYCFLMNKSDDAMEYYYMTDEEQSAIVELLNNGYCERYYYGDDGLDQSFDRSMSVYATSDSGVFRVASFEIRKDGSEYYINLYPDHAAFTDDVSIETDADIVVIRSTPKTDAVFDRFFDLNE